MQLNDLVEKIRGADKGLRGRVVAVQGNKVKVAKQDNTSFKLQASGNFKLIAAASASQAAESNATAERSVSTPRSVKPIGNLARGIEDRSVRGVQSPRSETSPLFASQHTFTVCCWNSLKLGFVEDPERSDLSQQCAHRLAVEHGADVIMLSEVSKVVGKRRVELFRKALEEESGCTYQVRFSELSGVGDRDTQPEYHVAFIKEGIKIEAELTHHHSGATKNDHAPFTVFLYDDRFADIATKRVAVTSVHFPPRNRPRDQLVQTRRFFEAYQQQLDWGNQYKLRRPMGFSALNKEFCTHLVGGDFNMNPSELGLGQATWTTLFDDATETSSGRRSYDNFVVNTGSYNAFLDISKNMGGFPLSHGGQALSDHDAVLVTLRERIHHMIL